MLFLIMGVAVAFNLMVIKVKLEKGRTSDAIMDAASLVLITVVFGGSQGSLMIGTIASAVVSIYLFFSPPKIQLFSKNKIDKLDTKEYEKKVEDILSDMNNLLNKKTRKIKGW